MKAVLMRAYGGPDVFALAHIEPPVVEPNDVLVAIHAAGFNPYDVKLRMGLLQSFFPLTLPAVIGCDFAGVVVAKGSCVEQRWIGESVLGIGSPLRSGAYAECIAVDATLVRPKPEHLSFEAAAAIPMAALTAWRGLVELARLQSGMRVLIHGAAGGVGSQAVQIAKALGAHVTTTCSAGNRDLALQLGADVVIDYERQDFVKLTRSCDVVFDPIGGDVNRRSYEVLRSGGVMLVVLRADPVEEAHRARMQHERGVQTHVVRDILQPDALAHVAQWLGERRIQPVLERVALLEDVSAVHAQCVTGFGRTGHARGKTVFKVR